jgi:Protein ENHANCED DISEASE RESISTANCE 2, C-terminal
MQIIDGSWVIRQAVGSTPFIVGRKLTTTYYRNSKYLEITVDIQSNATAASITGYVAGALKSLSISLGFVLEGQIQEHLPEQLFGARLLRSVEPLCHAQYCLM